MGVASSEGFIAWRYLYRRRASKLVLWLTLVFLLAAIGVQVAFFGYGHAQIGAVMTIPTAMLFIVFLLLNFFSVFTTVSIIGVILGVAALTVVLSVTSGFQDSFKAKVLGVNSHAIVLKYGNDFTEYRDVMKTATKEPHVLAAAPFVFNDMMIAHGTISSGVLLKGIDAELSPKVLDIESRLVEGKMENIARRVPPEGGGPPMPAIFIGKELAKKLHAKMGDRIRMVLGKLDMDSARWDADKNGTAQKEFRVGGIFYSGFDEYDRHLAYVNFPEAQGLLGQGDAAMGVELRVDDIDRAAEVSHSLLRHLGGSPYRVIDWEELNHNLFTALRMQKVALVIFLTLIILVAAFNIVAAMTMLVIDKTKEIAILKSMGMRSAGIAGVFQIAGLTIGGIGTAAGLALGLLLCAVVRHYGYHLDARVYLIDELPVQVQLSELALTAGITLAICFLATVYPSLKAAFLRPVDGLRYE